MNGIIAIRTDIPHNSYFCITDDGVGEIKLNINPPRPILDGIMYSVTRPKMGLGAVLWISIKNVIAVLYSDGSQVT